MGVRVRVRLSGRRGGGLTGESVRIAKRRRMGEAEFGGGAL